MHAYLLTGTDEEAKDKKARELADKKDASLMEFEVKKIKDVRELGKFTNLKLSQKTAVFIKEIDKATKEALNAFLKNLEEPQDNLFYILTANQQGNVLPTIVSRCQVIKVEDKTLGNKDLEMVQEFINMPAEERLDQTKKLKKKDDALDFIETMILGGHILIRKRPKERKKAAGMLQQAVVTREKILRNANPTLQLTNFCLNV